MKISNLIIVLIFIFQYFASAKYYEIQIPTRVEDTQKKYLWADLHSIDTNEQKPVILIQTPYNRTMYRFLQYVPPESGLADFKMDSLNYNYVIVDWRGFYGNTDYAIQSYDRGLDGYDIVEWIAEQKWCNGKIGTIGGSALGQIQFQTAKHKPPHLVCCVPSIKDPKQKYSDYFYGGVYRKEHTEALQSLGFLSTSIITSNYIYNNLWKTIENQADYFDEIAVPMLLISGWFDHYPSDIIRAFKDLREKSYPDVKSKHKLIMGPWLHEGVGNTSQGDLEFPEAEAVSMEQTMKFLDFYLRDIENNWEDVPNISYFIMGDNQWEYYSNIDEISADTDTMFFGQGGSLTDYPIYTSLFAPVEPDSLYYDPKDPSPTIGGSRFNPFDKKVPKGPLDISNTIESRGGVLLYTSDFLQDDYTIIGKTYADIFFSTNRRDTDFSLRLCDVYPDGRSIILTQGIKRARFRNSLSSEELLDSGVVYKISLELNDLAHTFKAGHRIRVVLSNSNYPMFDINLNDGGTLYQAGDTLTALSYIYLSGESNSMIYFPKRTKTGVESNENKTEEVNIFPIPFTDFFSVSTNTFESGTILLRLFNLRGKLLFEKEYEVNSSKIIQVNTSSIISIKGIYFLEIIPKNRENGVLRKIIIKD